MNRLLRKVSNKFERDWKYDASRSILSKKKLIRWCKAGENL
jgi:hypothetical protein